MSEQILNKLKDTKTFLQFNFSKFVNKLKKESDSDIKTIYEHLIKLEKIIDTVINITTYKTETYLEKLDKTVGLKLLRIDKEDRINEKIKDAIIPKLNNHFHQILNSNMSLNSKIIMGEFYLYLTDVEIFNSIIQFIISFLKDKESSTINKLLDDAFEIWNNIIKKKKLFPSEIDYIINSLKIDPTNIKNLHAKNIRNEMSKKLKNLKLIFR